MIIVTSDFSTSNKLEGISFEIERNDNITSERTLCHMRDSAAYTMSHDRQCNVHTVLGM